MRKQYRKRRPARRPKKSAPPSRSQVSSMIKKSLYKEAETHCLYGEVDEFQTGSQTGSAALRLTGQNIQNMCIFPARGDANTQRSGQSIQPIMWELKGHMRIPGASASQDNRVSSVRVVACTFDQTDAPNADLINEGAVLRYNGVSRQLFGDYRDTYAEINFAKYLPFYDKTFRMKPGYLERQYDSNGILTSVGETAGTTIPLRIRKFWKKGTKLTAGTTGNLYSQTKNGNIAVFIIARNANDDTTLSTLNVEICASTKFKFKDF